MRMILMFDLPSEDDEDRRVYTKFKKSMTRLGYTMMQYSVYVKCINAQSRADQEVEKIKKILPERGHIRVLVVTENQYQKMHILRGKRKVNEIYNNDRRYIKI